MSQRGRGRNPTAQGAWGNQNRPQQQQGGGGPPPQNAWSNNGRPQQHHAGPQPQSSGPILQGAWGNQGNAQSQPSTRPGANAWNNQQQQQQPKQQQQQPQQRAPQQQAKPSKETGIESQMKNINIKPDGSDRKKQYIQKYDFVNSIEPGKVKSGPLIPGAKNVSLCANYFKLSTPTNWHVYLYHVDFAPILDSTRLKKKIMRESKQINAVYIFDGNTLLTTSKLKNDVTEFLASEGENKITIKIKYIRIVESTEMEMVQIFNNVLRKCMDGLGLNLIGRNYFDINMNQKIPQYNLTIYRGFVTSIRQHENDLLLCVDMSSRVLRNETVHQIMLRLMNSSRDWQNAFKNALLGQTVLTSYNHKPYRIDDVDFRTNPTSTFETTAGPISFLEYYRKQYSRVIQDKGQPMLVSRAKARDIRAGKPETILLIPELCCITGITDDMRNDFNQMKEIANITLAPPNERVKTLKSLASRIKSTANANLTMQEWNLNLGENMVDLVGQELPKENIIFGNNRQIVTTDKSEWNDAFIKNNLYQIANLTNWVIICTKYDEPLAHDLVKGLQDATIKMGMKIQRPEIHLIQRDTGSAAMPVLRTVLSKDPQIIVVITPRKTNTELYTSVKKLCCVEHHKVTQFVTKNVIGKKKMAIFTKIAVQMNAKLGFAPWGLTIKGGTLVIGYDAYHNTIRKGNSFGAMVAHLKADSAKFFSVVNEHQNYAELSNTMLINTMAALRAYQAENNGGLPMMIFFYRDGVGDGQLQQVYESELRAVKEALHNAYQQNSATLRFAYIVVTKRINTRLFRKDTNNYLNPKPGTVVDTVITQPERYDFYLIAQSCNQGTVSPTSFNVLYDTTKLRPSTIQQATFKYCHGYYNFFGTIRVPSVCQYAHKLAFLCGTYLNAIPNTRWDNRLYYL